MLSVLLSVVLGVFQGADAKLPANVPPLVGTAVATTGKGDEWEIRLTVPKVRWEIVGKVVPKSEWPRLKAEVVKETVVLDFGGPSALAESRVMDIQGNDVPRADVLKRLKTESPVLVSVSLEKVDPYYLQVVKPDTLIIILGPRVSAPSPELLPALKGTPEPKGKP